MSNCNTRQWNMTTTVITHCTAQYNCCLSMTTDCQRFCLLFFFILYGAPAMSLTWQCHLNQYIVSYLLTYTCIPQTAVVTPATLWCLINCCIINCRIITSAKKVMWSVMSVIRSVSSVSRITATVMSQFHWYLVLSPGLPVGRTD